MFEGLKETLGRFREDAAEVAEAEADAAEADAADAETAESPAEGSDDATEGGAETDQAEAEEPGDPAADPDVSTAADPDAAETPGGTAEETAAAEPEGAEPEVDTDAADSGRSKPSFADRAKSLATGKVYLDPEDLEGPLWDLEMALLESDVEMGVAEELLETIEAELTGERKTITESTDALVAGAIREALLEVVDVDDLDFDEFVAAADKPVVIVFTGVNGVGKTTTIAKLSRYLEARGHDSVLANGDTYRAGANEQIEEHAERLGKRLISHERGGDPAAVIYDAVEYAEANDVDVVLGDTAGRLHTSNDLMEQLAKIDRVVDPDLTIFVDEAVAGQDAVNRAKEFNEAAAIDGSILTMADADAQGGAAISIASVTGKPILFFGTGQGYEDLEPFDPETFVEDLLSS
jgi:fused signal recognition particle receptor